MRRSVALLATFTAAAMVVAGCGGDSDPVDTASGDTSGCQFGPTDDAAWTETLVTAADQGAVTLFHTWAPDQANRFIEAFNEVCPEIEVTTGAGGAEQQAQVDAQIANNSQGADVFVLGDSQWFTTNEESLIPLDGPFSAEYPEDGVYVDGKAFNAFSFPFGMFVWNTNEFPDGFDSYEDLEDPAVAGRFGTRSSITAAFVGFLQFLEDEVGPDHLRALGDHQPKFYPSLFPMAQAVASGEIGVTHASTPAVVKQLKEQGAPVDSFVPNTSFQNPQPIGAIDTSTRPEAAKVLLEFVLSPEGQQALTADGYGSSLLDIEGDLDLGDGVVFDATTISGDVVAEWESGKFDKYFR
jgi:iron(III) transport system substrate-binding protein